METVEHERCRSVAGGETRWASPPGSHSLFASAQRRKWKKRAMIVILLASLILSMSLAVRVGAVHVSLEELVGILSRPTTAAGTARTIILDIRLPRVLASAMVGAALAVAGTTFQALFRNPMADPYVIGASSGAALGATVAILLNPGFRVLGVGAVPSLAFVGALVTVLVVYHLARVGHAVSVITLLLAGIAVGSFLSAIVSLLMYFSGERLHQVVFWLMGGFDGARWLYLKAALPYFTLGVAIVVFHTRELNCILMGDESARHLGINVERARKMLLAGATLLTATAVSQSGLIGFVGLIVPHVTRMIAGPDHSLLIPASALGGAAFMVAADTLARTVIAPTELPVGLVTALGGGPFFIYILRRRFKMRMFY
ncbi:MAG: iron chelate uptake ABC transporter family permease subunit [Bacillota bacterium]